MAKKKRNTSDSELPTSQEKKKKEKMPLSQSSSCLSSSSIRKKKQVESPARKKLSKSGTQQKNKINGWLSTQEAKRSSQDKDITSDHEKRPSPGGSTKTPSQHSSKSKRRKLEDKMNPVIEIIKCDSSKPKKKSPEAKSPKTEKGDDRKRKVDKKGKFNPIDEKYGIAVPTFETILADRRRFDNHQKALKCFNHISFENIQPPQDHNSNSSPEKEVMENQFAGELIDCRHLDEDDLRSKFKKCKTTLKHIMKGKISNDRHDRFVNFNPQFTLTTQDLTYSNSCYIFTHDQKVLLVSLIQSYLDADNKKLQYVFKVLLPELCLLIFMDCYDMERDVALQYLEERPVDTK